MSVAGVGGSKPDPDARRTGPGGLAPSRGERNLFPLPRVPLPSKVASRGHAAQTWRENRRRVELVNGAVDACNWLAGYEHGTKAARPPDEMQGDVLCRFDGLCRLVEQPKQDNPASSAREDFEELLRGRSAYGAASVNPVLASFRQSALSLPENSESSPCILELLSERGRRYVEGDGERMLRDEAERRNCEKETRANIYIDPLLARGGRRYARFVRDLGRRGLLRYGRWRSGDVGVFCVWKKGREKMRLILDCRRSNQLFKDPPYVALLTAEGLGSIEVE